MIERVNKLVQEKVWTGDWDLSFWWGSNQRFLRDQNRVASALRKPSRGAPIGYQHLYRQNLEAALSCRPVADWRSIGIDIPRQGKARHGSVL